jgi:hypothetical protein
MSMNLEEAISLYESMSDAAKAQLLGRLAFDITVEFRSVALEPTVTQSGLEKLQGMNEIQHKALAQMLAHQSSRGDRYPDRDFFLLLMKMGKNYGVAGVVQQSLMGELQKAS